MKVLVVDDDEATLTLLQRFLSTSGREVLTAPGGPQALAIFSQEPIDLILLDLVMPVMSGWDVLAKIRATSQVPILVLSDLDSPIEATKALLQGADDYVTKPFDLGELEARIRAILRRYQGAVPTRIFHVGDLTVDDSVKEVRRGGQLIRLSPTEYDLLKLFIRRPGKVLSHQQIIRAVWPQKPFVTSGDVIKYISLLREKLELDPEHPQLIVTVRGFGYMLERRAVERQAEPKGAHR